jgi:hypothetical protein
VLEEQTVDHGSAATAPADPARAGYRFTGWDKEFTNVTEALTVKALYEINKHAVTFVDWADTTRWRVINKALDLPFADITESYSTTPQLLADLGIPPDTRGRLADAVPRPRDDESRGDRDRHGKRGDHRRDEHAAAPAEMGRRERARLAGKQPKGDNPAGTPAKKHQQEPSQKRQRTRNGKPRA